MECAKKYQIEVEYLKEKFQSLTTVRINIKWLLSLHIYKNVPNEY